MTTAALLDRLEKTPEFRKLTAQAAVQDLVERREHVAEIERLRAEAAEARPGLEKTLEAKIRQHTKAAAVLQAAEAAVAEARGVLHNHNARANHAVGLHANALVKTAPPAIDDFIRELRDLDDSTRKMRPTTREGVSDRDEFGRPVYSTTHWTRPSILSRMAAIREAIAEADALKLAAVEDLPAAIDAIRQAIPSGTELVPLEA